jgi:hypothetical protein
MSIINTKRTTTVVVIAMSLFLLVSTSSNLDNLLLGDIYALADVASICFHRQCTRLYLLAFVRHEIAIANGKGQFYQDHVDLLPDNP